MTFTPHDYWIETQQQPVRSAYREEFEWMLPRTGIIRFLFPFAAKGSNENSSM